MDSPSRYARGPRAILPPRPGRSSQDGSERKYSIIDVLLGQDHQAAKDREGPTSLIRRLLEVTTNTALGAQINILSTFAFVKAAQEECARLEAATTATPGQTDLSASFARFKETIARLRKLEE